MRDLLTPDGAILLPQLGNPASGIAILELRSAPEHTINLHATFKGTPLAVAEAVAHLDACTDAALFGGYRARRALIDFGSGRPIFLNSRSAPSAMAARLKEAGFSDQDSRSSLTVVYKGRHCPIDVVIKELAYRGFVGSDDHATLVEQYARLQKADFQRFPPLNDRDSFAIRYQNLTGSWPAPR